jgi:hypothetical protein
MAAAPVVSSRRMRLSSVKGTLAAITGSRDTRWPQRECLKKKGRSSSTGLTSKG